MDPHFAERAHREWFLDGIGGLRIAKCSVAPILHDSGRGCKDHQFVICNNQYTKT